MKKTRKQYRPPTYSPPTSPHYPQSNGKLERFHRTLKETALRPQTPLSPEDARRVAGTYIDHYNNVRLHSAIDYVTPKDRLEERHLEIGDVPEIVKTGWWLVRSLCFVVSE